MTILLDTHAFLWFIAGDRRLSTTARTMIEDARNLRWLSMASVWEIAIKTSLGRLTTPEPIDTFLVDQLQRNGINLFPISLVHVLRVATLPFLHRDPFDRLIAAQCLTETIPIVSRDEVFEYYGATRLW